MVTVKKNKIYDVISVEKGYYRIITEIHEDYLLPPKVFEIVEDAEVSYGEIIDG